MQLTILRDNREQKPWDFEDFPVTTRDETINTGDYTLAEFCRHDDEKDTYYPRYAVERKAGQDFVSSVTSNRGRFLAEIKRAADWDSELLVLIEETKTLFRRQQGFMRYRDVSPTQLFGTIEEWEKYYNVNFEFVGTRGNAQKRAYDALLTRLRTNLLSGE